MALMRTMRQALGGKTRCVSLIYLCAPLYSTIKIQIERTQLWNKSKIQLSSIFTRTPTWWVRRNFSISSPNFGGTYNGGWKNGFKNLRVHIFASSDEKKTENLSHFIGKILLSPLQNVHYPIEIHMHWQQQQREQHCSFLFLFSRQKYPLMKGAWNLKLRW